LSDDLLEDLNAQAQPIPAQAAVVSASIRPSSSTQNLQELSRSAMRQAIESNSGNMSQAARQLGISRQTLYRKLNA
jgi:transcriptional regulator of acetoin/glycerol metabolism